MSYLDITRMTESAGLAGRITACAASEGITYPEMWRQTATWAVCSQPGWDEAWASAAAAGIDGDPGERGDVITDAQILAAVQAVRAQHPEYEGR